MMQHHHSTYVCEVNETVNKHINVAPSFLMKQN